MLWNLVQTNHFHILHQYEHWWLRRTRMNCENATCNMSFFLNDIMCWHSWAPALRAPEGWQSTRKDLLLLCLFTRSNLTIPSQTFICVLSCCDVLVTAERFHFAVQVCPGDRRLTLGLAASSESRPRDRPQQTVLVPIISIHYIAGTLYEYGLYTSNAHERRCRC